MAGESQEAGIGTYCWDGYCVDYWGGWIAPSQPMRLRSPFRGTLTIEVDPVPTGLYLSVHRFDGHVGRPLGDGRFSFWPSEQSRKLGPTYLLPLAKEQVVQLSRPPGLYVIDLSVFWKDVGDAAYAFLVEVMP